MSRLVQPSECMNRKSRNRKEELTSRIGKVTSKSALMKQPKDVIKSMKGSDKDITLRPFSRTTLQSNTKVTVTTNTGVKKVLEKNDESVFRRGSPSGTRRSAVVPIPSPSVLRKELSLQMKNMTSKAPMYSNIIGVGSKITKVSSLGKILTPKGPEHVLRKIITEKRLERTRHGERLAKSIRLSENNPNTGETIQVEEEFQKITPEYPISKGSIKEIVSIVSERDITTTHVTSRKNIMKETTKLTLDLGMNKDKVEHLVDEETEDVSNILKHIAPKLVNQASELFPLRKRLQRLRLSPENVAILEKSVVSSPVTADLPTVEASPELISTVMNVSEKSGMITIPPKQIFHSLFTGRGEDRPVIILSSASPGPLDDVVIPTSVDESVHEDILTSEMEQISSLVHFTDNIPCQDGYVKALPVQPKRRGRRKRPYIPLSDEDPPWSTEALVESMQAVGAHPSYSMHPINIIQSASQGTLFRETTDGVEYILDCQPLQHFSRVQLRGSQPPSWFPGYMVALSNMQDSVKIFKSPSEVLFSAWKSVQPEVFPEDSVVYN